MKKNGRGGLGAEVIPVGGVRELDESKLSEEKGVFCSKEGWKHKNWRKPVAVFRGGKRDGWNGLRGLTEASSGLDKMDERKKKKESLDGGGKGVKTHLCTAILPRETGERV